MKIISLASGSKANCTYICSNSTHILVDVGVSFAQIKQMLSSLGEDANKIDAVFITHEHIDHIKGLASLVKSLKDVKVFAHPLTMELLLKKVSIPEKNRNIITSSEFFYEDFLISAISLPHDSASCLAFSFFENGNKFSIATDLGFEKDNLFEFLSGSSLVFLESNYDSDLLYYCEKYPVQLRNRINSPKGHLSNSDCARLIGRLAQNGTARFALAHISENTNSPSIAKKACLEHLTNLAINMDNIEIEVLSQHTVSKIFYV